MTVIISGTQGTSTPGLYSNSTFTGTYADGVVLDYTTGLGRISVGTSDGLAFYNAGVATTELMRLDSSGNLGIGTNSPSAKLDTYSNTAGDATIRLANGYSSAAYAANIKLDAANASGSYYNGLVTYTAGTENWRIDGRGSANTIAFSTGSGTTERMRIDSSGALLVGTTNAAINAGAGIKLINGPDGSMGIVGATSTNANNAYHLYSTGAGAYRFYVGYDGVIHATITSITAIASDQRLKQDIVDYDKGLSEVMALRPRSFAYKTEPDRKLSGFISQEVQTVIPEAVEPTLEDPEMLTYSIDWYPLLVKAIQEQQAIIEALRADVEQLKGKA